MDARNGISFPGFKWELNSELINGSPRATFFFPIRPPHAYLKFCSGNGFILQENETEDQEVGSKDGIVDAWYEGIKNWGGWERVLFGSSLYDLFCLIFLFLLAFSIKHFQTRTLQFVVIWNVNTSITVSQLKLSTVCAIKGTVHCFHLNL